MLFSIPRRGQMPDIAERLTTLVVFERSRACAFASLVWLFVGPLLPRRPRGKVVVRRKIAWRAIIDKRWIAR